MDHQRSYSYTYGAAPQKQPAASQHTSSAFSPSANPNEDWTKISDLAERRRIQNRIAQRNYRKKLKKRLEDLERRAASSSASPEQKHEELDLSESLQTSRSLPSKDRVSKPSHAANHRYSASANNAQHYEDRSMFARQHTRQLSTSPPPFSCSSYTCVDMPATPRFSQPAQCLPPPPQSSPDAQGYQTYLPPLNQYFSSQVAARSASTKPAFYGEDEMSPFSMSYASLAGIEIPYAGGYQEQPLIHTPELSDTYEYSSAGSPCEFAGYPMTPMAMPLTPPLQTYEI